MWGIAITAWPPAPHITDDWKARHKIQFCTFWFGASFRVTYHSEVRASCVLFLHVNAQTHVQSINRAGTVFLPTLSILLSSLLPFLCDSLILCPSYGLRVSPHFTDSAGALPYPSLELHFAWLIPIRQRPCHEQKSHCDQACFQLPMSLLALAAPARCSRLMIVWTGLWFLSLVDRGRVRWMRMIQFRAEGVDGGARGYLDTDHDWEGVQTGYSFKALSFNSRTNEEWTWGALQTKPLTAIKDWDCSSWLFSPLMSW